MTAFLLYLQAPSTPCHSTSQQRLQLLRHILLPSKYGPLLIPCPSACTHSLQSPLAPAYTLHSPTKVHRRADGTHVCRAICMAPAVASARLRRNHADLLQLECLRHSVGPSVQEKKNNKSVRACTCGRTLSSVLLAESVGRIEGPKRYWIGAGQRPQAFAVVHTASNAPDPI